jgi:hypothetical protein
MNCSVPLAKFKWWQKSHFRSTGTPMKKRAVIYDFDGTIFNSPDREKGELTYLEATGELFPYQGWWGRPETLLPPIVPEFPGEEWLIKETIENYKKDALDQENTELILMTGRPYKNRKRIIAICNHFGLFFHKYYFRGMKGQKGRDTFEIKINIIKQDVIKERLTTLELWEDRQEHVSGFLNHAKKWRTEYQHLEKIIVHDVLGGKYQV